MMKLLVLVSLVLGISVLPATAQRPSLTEREHDKTLQNPELQGPVPPGTVVPEADPERSSRKQDGRTPVDRRLVFETDMLDWKNVAAREDAENKMKEHVQTWLTRIQRFEESAQRGSETNNQTVLSPLRKRWMALEQSYQKVVQSRREDHWRKSSADFRMTSEDLAKAWARAN